MTLTGQPVKQPVHQRGGIFYGWWIVLVCSLFNLVVGGTFFYGFTAFFNPLREEFGWTSAQTALGFSLQRLEGGIAAPVVGFLFDRVGPRKLILFGMIAAGCGLLLMSRVQSLGWFYTAFLVTAVGISFGWAGPPMYVIANWFIRKRGRALSLLMAGTGLSGLLVPLLVMFIARLGWRTSLIAVGVTFWLISIPVAILVKHKPEQSGYLPDGDTVTASGNDTAKERATGTTTLETNFSARQALRSRAFWLVSLAYMMAHFAVSAVMVLEMPHLENIGISREVAGLTVTFTTLISLGGRLGSGFLGDIIPKRYIIAAALGLQCLGIIIFANIQQIWQLIPFLIIYGTGYGATIPMRPAIMADYFGRTSLGTILGFMMSVALVAGVIAPVIAGRFFDITGNYRQIFLVYALISAAAIPLILSARPPGRDH